MAYSAGTAYLEVVPSFLNLESLLAKGARDIAKSLDKSLGAQLGKAMEGAAKDADRSSARAGQALGRTFADNALKNVQAAFAHIPETDRVLKPLRKELEDISKIDLGKGFDEKDFIGRVERAYDALRKAQQDAQGKNAVGRYTNAGNAAASLGQVKDIVEAARKRGFAAGDAFSDSYQSRLKAMDRALPDLKITSASSQEDRAVAALKQRIQDAMRLRIGDAATKDKNPLNLKIGAKIDGEDLKREMATLEGLLDHMVERFNTAHLVFPLDKARQQAVGFTKDIQTQEEKANEDAAKAYLKDWDAAVAERERREKSARDQIQKEWDSAIAENYKREKAARDQAAKEALDAAVRAAAEQQKIDEQNARLRLQQTRREIDERSRALRQAREQEYRDQQKAAAEAQRTAEKAAADLERERQRAAAAVKQSFDQSTAGDVQQRASRAADRIVALPVHLQANDIDKEMAAIRARIKAMGDLHIGIDVDADQFANRVRAEFDKLSRIAHNQKVDIEVRTDAARAATELGGILVLLNRIDHDKAEVKIDVDSALSNFAEMASQLSLNLGRLGGLIALGASLGTAIVPAAAAAAASIGAIGTAALAAGSGVGVMVLAFSGIGDAVKALSQYADNTDKSNVSLKRSASQVAGAQQQIRSAEMSLANTRRKNAEAAIKAQKSIKDAVQDQKDTVVDVARANQDAVEKVAGAERDLTEAHRDDLDARTKLNEAYVQAKRALEDLNSQLRGNSLDQRQATLDIAKAKADLDKLLVNPRATQAEREQADITYQQRLLQMDDLKRKGGELQDEQDKRFKQGVGQSNEVKKAREDLRKADQRVLDQQRTLTRAQQDQSRTQLDGARKLQKAQDKIGDARQAAADQQKDAAYSEYTATQSLISARRALETATNRDSVAGGAQLDNLQTAMAKLSPVAQNFAKYIFGLRQVFYDLRKAADPVLAGIQRAMESFLGSSAKEAEQRLAPVFAFVHKVAAAIGGLFERFAAVLKTPTFVRFFDYINATAVPTLDLLYQMFENVLVGVVNLFLAFTPLTDSVNDGLLQMTANFRKWSQTLTTNKSFQKFLDYLRDSAPRIRDLLVATVKAIGRLVAAAAPIGTVVVTMFTKLLNGINAIPQESLNSIVKGIAAAALAIGAFALASAAANLSTAGLVAGGLALLVTVLSGLAGINPGVAEAVQLLIQLGSAIAIVVGIVRAFNLIGKLWVTLTGFVTTAQNFLATAMARVQVAALGATTNSGLLRGSVLKLGGASVTAAGEVSLLEAAMGPLAVVMAGVAAIWAVNAWHMKKANDATDELAPALDELGKTARQAGNDAAGLAKIDDTFRSLVANNGDLQEAVLQLRNLGLTMDTITQSMTGNKQALDQVTTAIDAQIKQLDKERNAHFFDIFDNEKRSQEQAELGKLKDKLNDASKATDTATEANQALAGSQGAVASASDALTRTQQALAHAQQVVNDKTATAQDKMDALTDAQDALREATRNGLDAQQDFAAGEDRLREAVKQSTAQHGKAGTSLSIYTDIGRQNRDMIKDLIKSADDMYKSDVALNGVTDGAIQRGKAHYEQIKKVAGQMGINTKAVGDMITKYGDVPTNITTAIGFKQGDFDKMYSQLEEAYFIQQGLAQHKDIKVIQHEYQQVLGDRNRAAAHGWKTGGPVFGQGSATSDSIPAWLSNGEHVLTAAEVRRAGGHDVIYALRKALMSGVELPKFAKGGHVNWMFPINLQGITPPPESDAPSLGPLGTAVGKVGWAWQESVLRSVFGDRVRFTSTTGGGHAKNSWHYKGRALDSIGSQGLTMMAIFDWIKSHYGATSKELIYSPAVDGVKNGRSVNIKDFYGDSVWRQHFNHVHWAYDQGGLLPDTRQMPGGTMQVFHGRRTPDKVLTDPQWQSMATLAGQAQEAMAAGNTYNFPYRDSTLNYDELNRWSSRQDALARVNRRNY